MKKYTGKILVGILAVAVGILLSVQIATTAGSDQGGLVPLAKLKSFEIEYKQLEEEKDAAIERLEVVESKLDAFEKLNADDDEIITGLLEEKEKYEMMAGVVDVYGPGITVVVEDPPIYGDYIAGSGIADNYELLLSLINKLKEAGAEAISINGHRIIQTTEISLAANNININGKATTPPYTIKVIGNPETLRNTITIRGGIVESMRNDYNLSVSTEISNELTIPKYSGNINFRYAEPVGTEQVRP